MFVANKRHFLRLIELRMSKSPAAAYSLYLDDNCFAEIEASFLTLMTADYLGIIWHMWNMSKW